MAKILIVDDAAFVRMNYTKLLTDKGHEVTEAANGAEALAKYTECRPDGVLLDINMPVMDGIATLHEIMKVDPTARVAMVTCVGSQSIILTALKIGASDFVVKPTDGDGVIAAVQKLIAQ